MTTFIVTVHKLFNGIIPELSQRQELQIDALTADDAATAVRSSMGQDGWVVTNTEILGGPESENVKKHDSAQFKAEQRGIEYWNSYMPRVADTVKVIAGSLKGDAMYRVIATSPQSQRARIESFFEPERRRVVSVVDWINLEHVPEMQELTTVAGRAISNAAQIIGEKDLVIQGLEGTLDAQVERAKRAESLAKRARAKRRVAEKALDDLGNSFNELDAKHANLIEKAAAIDIENQKLREALRNMEELSVKDERKLKMLREQVEIFDRRDKEQIEVIQKLQREIREHESNREELLIERTKLREMVDSYKRENRDLTQRNSHGSEQVTELKAINQTKERQINELADERNDALAKNRELVKENADAKEMIRKQAQQIDDLIHEKPTKHVAGPTKDVDWSEAWVPQLGEDEELTLKTLIGQALGAASMCWQPIPEGIYWPEQAEWILGGVINQIEKLEWEKQQARKRPSQPVKPVEDLVREQDTDARLWANSFANQFDLPEELDAEITGWFANAIETAKDSVRNRNLSPNPSIDKPVGAPRWLTVPAPESWQTPEQYAAHLQGHLQATLRGLMEKLQPVLDAVGPMVANVEKEYPGWIAANYRTKEEWFDGETAKDCGWSVAQNLAEKTPKPAGMIIEPDGSLGAKVQPKADGTYEFVNAPKHYNDHPSGVECQVIIRECKDPMIAIAFKHLWRTQWGNKPGQTVDQDLGKAIEYIQLEQARRAGKDRL